LGDSYQIISSLEKGEFFIKWSELGDSLFHIYLYKLLNPLFHIDAATLYELSSCFLGVIFVYLVFLLVDFLGEDKWEKLFLFFLIIFMGSIQLFCGYAEHYSLSYVLVFAFTFLSLKYLRAEGNPFLPLLLFSLAVFSHISVSYFLPSVFLLYLLGYAKQKESPPFLKKEIWSFLLLVLITLLIFLYMKENSWTVGNKYVPLSQGDYYAPGYTLFSSPHILDIVNQQLLISPLGFMLLICIWACLRVFNFKDRSFLFLFSILLLGMGFNFIMYPGLGMSRDWDMFSSTAIGYTILSGYLFLKLAKNKVNFKYAGSVLIITTVFCSLPWVLLNTSEQSSVKRFRNLMQLDPKKSRNGHYALAAYFNKKGMFEEGDRENQAQADNFPELVLVNRGFELLSQNQLDKAFELCKKALAMEPDFAEAHLLLGKIYQTSKVPYLAEKEFKLAIKFLPAFVEPYAHLGHLYVFTQRLDSAFYYYTKAVSLRTSDPHVYNNLGNIYSKQKNWEKAFASYRKALELDHDFAEPHYGLGIVYLEQHEIDQALSQFKKACEIRPDFALAHYHLAYLYAQKGEKDKAEEELKLFSNYFSDENEVEKLRQMIDSLLKK
jgi:Tfp pilus assembly protein PilF